MRDDVLSGSLASALASKMATKPQVSQESHKFKVSTVAQDGTTCTIKIGDQTVTADTGVEVHAADIVQATWKDGRYTVISNLSQPSVNDSEYANVKNIASEANTLLDGVAAAAEAADTTLAQIVTDAAAAATLHPVYTIPADLLPVAGYENDIASLTEAAFRDELVKAKLQVGGSKLKLLGLVGTKLKVLMSEWLGKATTVQGVEALVRATRNANDKRIQMICDEFAYDGVDLKVICADTLLADTSNGYVLQDASYKSGIFIRPEMWGVQTLEPITHYETEDKGAGPGGYHDASLRLTCLNPMGQFRVKHIPGA